VVLTGAGISAESGLSTFRSDNGLWENHRVEDVATFDGWLRDKELVLNFYNTLRQKLPTVQPNIAHLQLADLQEHYNVFIITQNVDDLHERAGSQHIIHLHGELTKVCSSEGYLINYQDIGYNSIHIGDKCRNGTQLRPHVVWFGEPVPEYENALSHVLEADIFAVIGTSLAVYPAAALIQYVPKNTPKYIIDPNIPPIPSSQNIFSITEKATIGVPLFAQKIKF